MTTIKRSPEIRAILQNGKHVSTAQFKVAYLIRHEPPSRWAILVGKRYGKAVERNRIKRQWREILREVIPRLQVELDLLVMPRKTGERITFQILQKNIQRCFKKEGLLRDEQA